MHMLSTGKYVSDLYKFKRENKPSYMSAQEMKKKKKRKQVLLFQCQSFRCFNSYATLRFAFVI